MKKIIIFLLLCFSVYAQTYTKITIDELLALLDANSYRTKIEYVGKDIELTGELFAIDMDGKYIGLALIERENVYSTYYVFCNITSDDERAKIINMNEDDIVTVRGTITEMDTDTAELDVHEILN